MDAERNNMRSPFQVVVLTSLHGVLLPIVKLMLRCGVGCPEFVAVTKAVYVQAATEDYGVRGRPANVSRVAAMTGLSRKEVSRIRSGGTHSRWTPDMEVTPANTVLHYWHFDPAFSDPLGVPRPLPFEGANSFSSLVKTYAGDIPAGAFKKALLKAGTVAQDNGGNLLVKERYFYPASFNEDFVRNAAFALKNLGETLVYNALLTQNSSDVQAVRRGRFERFAWTDRLDKEAIDQFKRWVRREGALFVERADAWIGQNERPVKSPGRARRTAGVGVYFFEEDSGQ